MTFIIGLAASIFTGISLLPQLVKIIKEKKAENVSMWMLLILITGLALWVWYGFKKEDYILIVSNSFSILVNLSIIILAVKYKKEN